MTAVRAAAAMPGALRAEVAAALDDEHADRQAALERTAAKLAAVAAAFHAAEDELNSGNPDALRGCDELSDR